MKRDHTQLKDQDNSPVRKSKKKKETNFSSLLDLEFKKEVIKQLKN